MSLLRPPVLASVLLLLSACGGKVVFQEDGGEGGDAGTGANGPGPAGPGPGGTTGTFNSTSSGTVATPCDELCTQHPECFPGPDCLEQCKGFYVGDCVAETDALILCYAYSLGPNCEPPPDDPCFAQRQAVEQCQNPSDCRTYKCGASDQSCDCFGQCYGIDLEENCYYGFKPGPGDPPPLQVTCDCFTGGDYLGSCNLDDLYCDLSVGCCQYLLLDGQER